MKKYILINHRRVFMKSIVAFEYNQEVLSDGEIVDRTPIHETKRFETLKISLISGEEIELEGRLAAEIAATLEANSKCVATFEPV